MDRKSKAVAALIMGMIVLLMAELSLAEVERWHDPRCTLLPTDKRGPFIKLSNGSIMTIEKNATLISEDNGQTWSESRKIYDGPKPGIPSGGLGLKTHNGVIVLVYMDMSTIKRGWADGEPAKDMRLDVWSIRSLDEGKTWVDRQMIAPGYCGAIINIIQTKSGHIAVPVQAVLRNPGRHGQYVYVSADDGKSWKRSNLIDIGGAGDHDGGFESTVVELSDGRLLMLLRTNLDRFWQAFSDDHGYYWRVIQPSQIDASSAPGYLKRLASGRIVLVWNRLYPQGRDKDSYPRYDIKPSFELRPSYQREELSIAFSEDDGKTWSKPIAFAGVKGPPEETWKWIRESNGMCYPYVFEQEPGLLWITTGSPPTDRLHISLREADFIEKTVKPKSECSSSAKLRQFRWAVHDMNRPAPPIVAPGERNGEPPSDAIVLFDGKDLLQWESKKGKPAKWKVENGYMEVVQKTGNIRTKQSFGDCQLHIEWATPKKVSGKGQHRGNSGVFLMKYYEVQVLDSYGNTTYPDGQAAALYGQYSPMVNASRGPGKWQSYDIIFRRPKFDEASNLTEPAHITVLHNGVLVQDNVEVLGAMAHKKRAKYHPHPDKLPIELQDHRCPVRYRNIWIRELGEPQQP